jgi:hypothetical protein
MTEVQENRMYELFGKEGINEQEEHELTSLVDVFIQDIDEQMAEFNID